MSRVQSIKCTHCGAPLKLLGGGRVESVTCAYCNSVLDLNDNYKVLSNFRGTRSFDVLPFKLGMMGEVKGIVYTIIGRVTYVDAAYPTDAWTEYLLFSPLYGYAWLTYENGTLLYSRRNRTFPNLTWQEIMAHNEVVVDDKSYRFLDRYTAKIVYVEGELTWVAKKNDNVSFVDFMAPPYGLSVEKSKDEIEYYKTEYLEATKVYEAFNISKEEQEKEQAFHPLKPFEQPFIKALSQVSMWALLLVALLYLGVIFDGQGKVLSHFSADNRGLKEELFTLDSTKYLTTIELKAANTKMLNNFMVKVFKEDKLLFLLSPSRAYTYNYDTQMVEDNLGSWEKRAKEGMIYLNLEALGSYKLSIIPIDKNVTSSLSITVKEEASRVNYLVVFAVVLMIFFLWYYWIKWRYHRRLKQEQDVEDKDENALSAWWFYLLFVAFVLFMNYLEE